ncbi:MAG: NUDIX hydrolase [Bacteroidota bacterium]|jgi:8-oxo-dGTP pyrophosphatase MutT (NUDIX family)
MQFEPLHIQLRFSFQGPLPGEEAQSIMAPVGRPSTESMLLKYPNHRKSAVMMLIFPDEIGVAHTVFMERAHDGSLHSGQIGFPGGGLEHADPSPMHAALREFEEEVGVSESHIEVIGPLTPLFIPASRFMVYPFVGIVHHTPVFTPDPVEVQSLIQTPIKELLTFEIEQGSFPTSYGTLQAPCYRLNEHKLWGATAMIVSEFRILVHKTINK